MTSDEALRELEPREPIFHRPRFARTSADFAGMMAEDYWEVGASGQVYTRAFILEHLAQNPPVDADEAGWIANDFDCRQIGPDTFLLTYFLDQQTRRTRRATVWRLTDSAWQVLYHQGTVIQG